MECLKKNNLLPLIAKDIYYSLGLEDSKTALNLLINENSIIVDDAERILQKNYTGSAIAFTHFLKGSKVAYYSTGANKGYKSANRFNLYLINHNKKSYLLYYDIEMAVRGMVENSHSLHSHLYELNDYVTSFEEALQSLTSIKPDNNNKRFGFCMGHIFQEISMMELNKIPMSIEPLVVYSNGFTIEYDGSKIYENRIYAQVVVFSGFSTTAACVTKANYKKVIQLEPNITK